MRTAKPVPGADCNTDLMCNYFICLKLRKLKRDQSKLKRFDLKAMPFEYTVEEDNKFKELKMMI